MSNSDFEQCKAKELRGLHAIELAENGFPVVPYPDEKAKLKDFYCKLHDTYVECKTDSHNSGNVCIELLSNLEKLPSEFTPQRRKIYPTDKDYLSVIDELRALAIYEPNKRALGLDKENLQ